MATNPRALTKDENIDLYKAFIAGDDTTRNKLIEGNLALVVFRVDSLLETLPHCSHHRDDLISEGWLRLTEVVDSFRKRRIQPDNVTAYFGLAVQQAMTRYLDRENVISVPDRTRRRSRKAGEELIGPQPEPIEAAETKGKLDPEFGLIELREEIESCCQTEIELKLVRWASRGHTNKQLADLLGMTLPTVNRIRRTIYSRFLEKTGMSEFPSARREPQRKKKCSRSKESASTSMAC